MGRPSFILYIFLGIGVLCLYLGAMKAKEGWEARRWPTAKGRIIVSKVDEFRTGRGIRVARLCLDIDYLYMVKGVIYEGHRVNVGWACFGSESSVKRALKRYPVGKEVEVHYDPRDPSRALLEPGLDWSVLFLWGIASMSLGVAWPLIRGRRR